MKPVDRYPYNTGYFASVVVVVIGIPFIVFGLIHLIPMGIGLVFGLLPCLLGLFLLIRRLCFPRFIELEHDTLLLPAGLFQWQLASLAYTDIDGLREGKVGHARLINLHVQGRSYSIVSTLLPDGESYEAVKDFLTARVKPKAPAFDLEKGHPYCSRLSWDGDGEVVNHEDKVVWQIKDPFATDVRRFLAWLIGQPDLVIYDGAGQERFKVVRQRGLWFAKFVMYEGGLSVCTIRQRSPLSNWYVLEFVEGENWTFRMPLFTVNFKGTSATSAKVRVRNWNHKVWFLMVDPAADHPQFVAALAFIHRERLRCPC